MYLIRSYYQAPMVTFFVSNAVKTVLVQTLVMLFVSIAHAVTVSLTPVTDTVSAVTRSPLACEAFEALFETTTLTTSAAAASKRLFDAVVYLSSSPTKA